MGDGVPCYGALEIVGLLLLLLLLSLQMSTNADPEIFRVALLNSEAAELCAPWAVG